MTMFREGYKKDFNSITANASLIENTTKRLSNNLTKRYFRIRKRFVAAAAAICLLIGGAFMANNLNKPAFALVALAADSGDHYIKIDENTKVTLPFGKISRGDRDFYLDETGKKIYSYDVGFDHGGISVRGDHIAYVKYTSNLGELSFFDSIAAKKIEPPKQDEEQEEVMLHILEDAAPFMQAGKEITISYHAELGEKSFDVNWFPWYAIDIVSKDEPVNFADLPSDNIIIEVYFENGKTMTKQLHLHFDHGGNLIAEIMQE